MQKLEPEFQNISVERVREYLQQHDEQDYMLVDVRQPGEYNKGHIPGAILMPLGEIPERMAELETDKDIIFYCRSGNRSKGAAIFVGSQPHIAGTVFNMTGGILAWNGELLASGPRLRIFDLSGDECDILYRGMELERGAAEYYLILHQRYGDSPWAETLSKLADAEKAHAMTIYRAWAEQQTAPPAFSAVYADLRKDLVEGGMTTHDLLDMLASDEKRHCHDILEMALSIEYVAYDLSRNMAHHWRDRPLEAVFHALAEGEKEHIMLVARALSLCPEQ